MFPYPFYYCFLFEPPTIPLAPWPNGIPTAVQVRLGVCGQRRSGAQFGLCDACGVGFVRNDGLLHQHLQLMHRQNKPRCPLHSIYGTDLQAFGAL